MDFSKQSGLIDGATKSTKPQATVATPGPTATEGAAASPAKAANPQVKAAPKVKMAQAANGNCTQIELSINCLCPGVAYEENH